MYINRQADVDDVYCYKGTIWLILKSIDKLTEFALCCRSASETLWTEITLIYGDES